MVTGTRLSVTCVRTLRVLLIAYVVFCYFQTLPVSVGKSGDPLKCEDRWCMSENWRLKLMVA
jgi:hypothetical protein